MKRIQTAILSSLVVLLGINSFAQQKLTVANATDGTFNQESVRSLSWMNDGQFYSALSQNKIIKYSVSTGEPVETLVDGSTLNINIRSYSFSDDETMVLLMTDRQSVYRRSYTAVFYLYDRNNKQAQLLANGRQAYATISPDNSKVAFTRDNNLFFVDISSGAETAVTSDGKFNEVINGIIIIR